MSGALGFVTRRRLVEWAAIVAGFVAVHFVGRPSSLIDWLLLVPAGALIVTPVVLAAQREYVHEREAGGINPGGIEAGLRDAMFPLAEMLGRIATEHGIARGQLQAQLMQQTVDLAAAGCSADGVSAVLLLSDVGTLTQVAWSGRAAAPVAPVASEGARRLRQVARHHGRMLIADTRPARAARRQVGRLPHRLEPDGEARCMAIAEVSAGPRRLGLLVVCAAEPDSLHDTDVDLVATLAGLLGAGLAVGHPAPDVGAAPRPDGARNRATPSRARQRG